MSISQLTRFSRSAAASLVVVAATLAAAACSSEPTPTPVPTEVPATPTVVTRVPPTPTPTPTPDPMSAVESEEISDVVVPMASELVEFVPADGEEDARADYRLPDVDGQALRAWFLENMPEAGWDEGEDRDGALVFRHQTQESPHEADDGEVGPRTVLVLFGVIADTDFSILAEPAPAP